MRPPSDSAVEPGERWEYVGLEEEAPGSVCRGSEARIAGSDVVVAAAGADGVGAAYCAVIGGDGGSAG